MAWSNDTTTIPTRDAEPEGECVLLLAALGTEPMEALCRAAALAAADGVKLLVGFAAPRDSLAPAGSLDRLARERKLRGEAAAWARRHAGEVVIAHTDRDLVAWGVALAREHRASLVVLDEASLSMAARRAGSIAESASVPVLLVRPSSRRRSVLVATAAGEPAEVVITTAGAFAERCGLPMVTVHDATGPRRIASILALAERIEPQVIAVAAPRRSGLARALFPSVSESLAEKTAASVLFTPVPAA